MDEARTYFLEEIKQRDLTCTKHKTFCITVSYIKQLLNLVSAITGCDSVSVFGAGNAFHMK